MKKHLFVYLILPFIICQSSLAADLYQIGQTYSSNVEELKIIVNNLIELRNLYTNPEQMETFLAMSIAVQAINEIVLVTGYQMNFLLMSKYIKSENTRDYGDFMIRQLNAARQYIYGSRQRIFSCQGVLTDKKVLSLISNAHKYINSLHELTGEYIVIISKMR